MAIKKYDVTGDPTPDATPTNGELDRPCSSDGVFDALALKMATADDAAAALAAAVGTSIADAEAKAPSGDTVFHALAGKAPSSGIALSALADQAAQTVVANATDGADAPTAVALSTISPGTIYSYAGRKYFLLNPYVAKVAT
jgi:hypothetical protein